MGSRGNGQSGLGHVDRRSISDRHSRHWQGAEYTGNNDQAVQMAAGLCLSLIDCRANQSVSAPAT